MILTNLYRYLISTDKHERSFPMKRKRNKKGELKKFYPKYKTPILQVFNAPESYTVMCATKGMVINIRCKSYDKLLGFLEHYRDLLQENDLYKSITIIHNHYKRVYKIGFFDGAYSSLWWIQGQVYRQLG